MNLSGHGRNKPTIRIKSMYMYWFVWVRVFLSENLEFADALSIGEMQTILCSFSQFSRLRI